MAERIKFKKEAKKPKSETPKLKKKKVY